MSFDPTAATHFGRLRSELYSKGQSPVSHIIPYDMMIAGHARSMGLTLVTNHLREFERVPGLRVANWL